MATAKPTLSKIEQIPQTLRDIAQDRMRTAIIEGHFAPGERLIERPLGEQLGVSRTVIRETIRYLEAEGLVENIPNRGPIVAKLDWPNARQIYDIRRQLEASAAAICAQTHSDLFEKQLKQALADIEKAMNAPEWIGVMTATTHFYAVIFEEAGHTVAWEIVQRLNGRISRLRVLTLSDKSRPQPGITYMKAICDAILSRDAKAARTAVEQHIEAAAFIAERFLAQDETKEHAHG